MQSPIQAAQVVVQTERDRSQTDVLVRAIADQSRMNDGRPVAGFYVRRRYHGDTFYIQKAEEFSARWMEFVGEPPAKWLPIIKKNYPDFEGGSRFEDEREAAQREPSTMAEAGNLAKIDSGAFDYANGAPKRKRAKLNLS